jgi:hypothetical protein
VVDRNAFRRDARDWAYGNQRAESLYDEVGITDKCAFSEGELQNFKIPEAKGDNLSGILL